MASHIGRRKLLATLGGAAAWPLAARAQQPAMPVVGFLGDGTPELRASHVRAFRQGLSEQGYAEGRNFAFEFRWAEGRNDRLPALAADLVRRQVAVLVAGGTPPALAAKAATSTIPILFDTGGDPVELGLVSSLNRPGGNLTGATSLNVEIGAKRLQLLHELVPAARIIALLVNPANPNGDALSRRVQVAARTLGLELYVLNASTEREFDPAFATLTHVQAGGLVIATDGLFLAHGEQLGAYVLRHRMPAIFAYHEFAAAGGLMSYGGSLTDQYRLLGAYAGRILKGESPADLPVQQVTKIELIISLKTAKALGLEVPPTLLARADEVIE
jgi:putative tryptophan/tyrosine transport system substrate-binding protein